MGNSLTPQPHQLSKKELLKNQYQLFTIPPQFQNNITPSPTSSQTQGRIVYGKKYLKGIFNLSTNFVHPSECEKQIDQYFLRHQSQQLDLFPIVKVLGAKEIQQNNVFSSYNSYCVITQDLSLFEEIENKFSFDEGLFLLFECLMGFYYLYIKNGSFNITEKMIGINNQGKVKVWMSQNFAFNRTEDSTFQVYITKNFTSQGQQRDNMNYRISQRKMIKQIFSIINAKYQNSSSSFSQTLEANIKRSLREVSVQETTFEELLKTLCEYEQKVGNTLFIPNKIRLQKGFESKLPQRESLSLKLQKAINSYRNQRRSIEERESIDRKSEKAYSTGMDGNTLKRYMTKENESVSQSTLKRPEVKFYYQDFGMQSGLLQSGYLMNENMSHFNFSQYHRDYSVRDAQSEMIGIRRSEYVERLDDFNNTRSRNEYVNQSYVQGDYEQEISSMSKDMRDTYFKSTGGSQVDNPWFLKSSSHGEGKFMDEKITRSNSQLQLISSKFVEDLTSVRQTTTPTMSIATPTLSINWKNPNSIYKQKNIAPYLREDSTNNFMRITEQLQQQSYRPSLMSINIDGRSSYDKSSLESKLNQHNNSRDKQSSQLTQQNIISPIIESRFTQNLRLTQNQRLTQDERLTQDQRLTQKLRNSPGYIEKPFSLAFNNNPKLSLDPYDKSNFQTGESFY